MNCLQQCENFLNLQNIWCQKGDIAGTATSLIQKNFDVTAKTNQLTLAFQDEQAGLSPMISETQLKIIGSGAGEKFPLTLGQELELNRFYIQFNNTQKPSPDYDGAYKESLGAVAMESTNYMTQRWVDSLLQTGAFHTEGGAESFHEWVKRGPFFHFVWPKDAKERGSRVSVSFKFSDQLQPAGKSHFVLLFNWWRTAVRIENRNGKSAVSAIEDI